MIITISGVVGSGKGTVGRMLAERLHYRCYSMGDLRRHMAHDRGMTLEDFNKLGEDEAFTDKDADEYQVKLGKTEDNFIMDGRVSYYFIPNSLKIFLYVDPKVAAERVFNDKDPGRINQQNAEGVDDQFRINVERNASDRRRYEKYYGIKDFADKKNYDLYIDTSKMTPEQVVDKILDKMNS